MKRICAITLKQFQWYICCCVSIGLADVVGCIGAWATGIDKFCSSSAGSGHVDGCDGKKLLILLEKCWNTLFFLLVQISLIPKCTSYTVGGWQMQILRKHFISSAGHTTFLLQLWLLWIGEKFLLLVPSRKITFSFFKRTLFFRWLHCSRIFYPVVTSFSPTLLKSFSLWIILFWLFFVLLSFGCSGFCFCLLQMFNHRLCAVWWRLFSFAPLLTFRFDHLISQNSYYSRDYTDLHMHYSLLMNRLLRCNSNTQNTFLLIYLSPYLSWVFMLRE